MTDRDGLGDRLDAAVRDFRVVLLDGLPRVGRTRLATRWAEARTNVAVQPIRSREEPLAPILLHDHVEAEDAVPFAERVREAERSGQAVRYVLLPGDIATTKLLEGRLTGITRTLLLHPMCLEDYDGGLALVKQVHGPAYGATPGPSPLVPAPLDVDLHWLRGGLPESLFASSDASSLEWRRQMLGGLLGREYGAFRVTEASGMPELLLLLAQRNGSEFDEEAYNQLKRQELKSALHVLERLGLIRRLPNLAADHFPGRTLRPKLYLRDSGLLHAQIGIETIAQLRTASNMGESWEGYAIEALVRTAGAGARATFFRAVTQEGKGEDEIDLVLDLRPRQPVIAAIEMKAGPRRRARGGFFRACDFIGATDRFIVHSSAKEIGDDALARLDLAEAIARVATLVKS